MLSDTKISYENALVYKTMILRTCGNIPIVFVVNKSDLNKAVVNYNKIQRSEGNIVLISCKNYVSIYEPLDRLINC